MKSDNPFDSFIYAAKKYSNYMKDDDQKIKFDYLLKITRELHNHGLNERERLGILVLVSRLIALENPELRIQYTKEVKKMKGESDMAELTWLEELFMRDGIEKGRKEGIAIGKEQACFSIFEKLITSGMDRTQAAEITGVTI